MPRIFFRKLTVREQHRVWGKQIDPHISVPTTETLKCEDPLIDPGNFSHSVCKCPDTGSCSIPKMTISCGETSLFNPGS